MSRCKKILAYFTPVKILRSGYIHCIVSVDGGKWQNLFCQTANIRYYGARFVVNNGKIEGFWANDGIMCSREIPLKFFRLEDDQLLLAISDLTPKI